MADECTTKSDIHQYYRQYTAGRTDHGYHTGGDTPLGKPATSLLKESCFLTLRFHVSNDYICSNYRFKENFVMIAIGKLSQKTGVKIETIRYYEKEGLMPEPFRKASGHRIYSMDQVKQLRFIKRGRELGFSLKADKNAFILISRSFS